MYCWRVANTELASAHLQPEKSALERAKRPGRAAFWHQQGMKARKPGQFIDFLSWWRPCPPSTGAFGPKFGLI